MEIPRFYLDLVRKDLGLLWEWLPKGALDHDPNAYSKSDRSGAVDRPPQKPDLCNIGAITVTEAAGSGTLK